ncbi:hypothetical protein Syun_007680 [Stephania yunnanensis]|uniref:Uncharacterized protein n=1 Tax=Stephania yunnanensis TaxID=152371 RepID=A0AAP0L2N5_9MAGN
MTHLLSLSKSVLVSSKVAVMAFSDTFWLLDTNNQSSQLFSDMFLDRINLIKASKYRFSNPLGSLTTSLSKKGNDADDNNVDGSCDDRGASLLNRQTEAHEVMNKEAARPSITAW